MAVANIGWDLQIRRALCTLRCIVSVPCLHPRLDYGEYADFWATELQRSPRMESRVRIFGQAYEPIFVVICDLARLGVSGQFNDVAIGGAYPYRVLRLDTSVLASSRSA